MIYTSNTNKICCIILTCANCLPPCPWSHSWHLKKSKDCFGEAWDGERWEIGSAFYILVLDTVDTNFGPYGLPKLYNLQATNDLENSALKTLLQN